MGKMGKNFLKTNLTVDNLKQLGSKDNSPVAPDSHNSAARPIEFAIFSPPVGEAPSQAFAYFFCFCRA